MIGSSREFRLVASAFLAAMLGFNGPAASADLGGGEYSGSTAPVAQPSDWTFAFTTYGWLPWISGDLTVKGRSFDVDVSARQVVDALDWSGIPAWFSYAEARNGRVALFNDIVYSKLAGSGDFARTGPGGRATLSGNVKADYEQAIVEVGGAYEIWSGVNPGMGAAAFDVLAGGRYWYQNTTVSAAVDLALDLPGLPVKGGRVFDKSGSIDWIDPFIGARLRQQLAPGHNLTLRGDVGGFDVGSDFTWQVLATYDFQLCVTDRYTLDGYLGYRALSVDYSQGSGNRRYEFDALMQGPVMGATMRF
jgi:hypothetical protein